MKLNEQIRAHRKEVGLTQEQVANYLGVSTPAVNKWESGSSYPDITLLAPLARLLKIDLNTLFTFHETLSKREIGQICNEVENAASTRGVHAGFNIAIEKLQEFPTSDSLRYHLALLLDGILERSELTLKEKAMYGQYIIAWYEETANSQDDETRESAISVLVTKHLASGKFEKAQELIDLLPEKRTVDKQMLKIDALIKQEQYKEAATLTEMKIFSDLATMQNYLIRLVGINLLLNETDHAAYVSDVSQRFASLFELWEYTGFVCQLQVAIATKDIYKSVECLKAMFDSALAPIKSPTIFTHLPAKTSDDTLGPRVVSLMIHQLETDSECEFLRFNSDYQALVEKYKNL